jgi:hypothetical protein
VTHPEREIRADFGPETITVYQAYSEEIAKSAVAHQTFVSPPFSMSRMTWIKPSFLWMMYRSGWARKDPGQARILAIEITHEGFDWALRHGCPSKPEGGMTEAEWRAKMAESPVRVQWDPERNIDLDPLPHRAIQIGLSGEAVQLYTSRWIKRISDMTRRANQIYDVLQRGDRDLANALLPRERPYPIGMNKARYLEMERERLLDPGHEDHEEIVRLLQDFPENESVPYLAEAIRRKPDLRYLAYDDYGAYYKKCLWALRAIGTSEAIARIMECARSDEEPLREEARHRLKRIAEEDGHTPN